MGAHRAEVAPGDGAGERRGRLAAAQQVLQSGPEQNAEVLQPVGVARGRVHQPFGLALERDQQVASHHGGEVVERLALVGQPEGTHAEADGQLLAELQVALLQRRHGAGDVAQQSGCRLADEGLQRVQAQRARALFAERLEQVHGAEAAGVDGQRWRRAAPAHGRQSLGEPSGHAVDLVVRDRQPPGVGFERGVAHAQMGQLAEEMGVVVGVHADGTHREVTRPQARQHGGSQASGADHAEAICVDGQAFDLSGCGPPCGGGTAPVARPVQHRRCPGRLPWLGAGPREA